VLASPTKCVNGELKYRHIRVARLGVEFDAGTKVEIGLYAQRYDLRADTVGQIIRASASIISAASCANAAPRASAPCPHDVP
jgi:hypothetical protein